MNTKNTQNQFKIKVKKHFIVNTKIWENQFKK